MKIETIVTAVIFLSVGFLAGFIYKSQTQSSAKAQAAVATSASRTVGSSAASNARDGNDSSMNPTTGLPNGHPSLEVSEIIQHYTRRADLKPSDPKIPLELANYLYNKHYFGLAIKWYQKCLMLKPKDLNARTDLGTCYFYSGQPGHAIAEYKKVLAIDPHHRATLFNMIVVNMEGTHKIGVAEKYWRILDQQDPSYPGLKQIKARLDAMPATADAASKP